MSEPPRRRRPPESPRRSGDDDGRGGSGRGLAATIVVGIGVVVAGLGIGAFISALQQRDAHTATTTVATIAQAPTVTPVGRPTARATEMPTVSPSPTASPSDTPTPGASPSPKASPTHAPTATAKPSVAATASPTALAAASATPTAHAETARPETARPEPMRTKIIVEHTPGLPSYAQSATGSAPATPPAPVVRPAPAREATESPVVSGQTGFAAIATNTVRRYLADLVAGNENAAYAELGKPPGDGSASLREEAFLDRSARIISVRTSATDATGATVQAEVESSHGRYFATYHVANGSGTPVIDYHDYIKE